MDSNNPLHLEHFSKLTRHSRSFGDFNNHGRNGWSGEGYFKLEHQTEVFHFKAYTFKHKDDSFDYSPDISIYRPIHSDQDFLVIDLFKNDYNDRSPETAGIYVLRKKL